MEKLPSHLQLTPSQNLFCARGPKFQFKFHYETDVSGFDVLTHIWMWMDVCMYGKEYQMANYR